MTNKCSPNATDIDEEKKDDSKAKMLSCSYKLEGWKDRKIFRMLFILSAVLS